MKRVISLFLIFIFFTITFPQEKEQVYKFNTVNRKYHYSTCKWAVKCTKNCIDLTLKEIKERKGIPCKVCKPPKY